jgi:hypothetical protein
MLDILRYHHPRRAARLETPVPLLGSDVIEFSQESLSLAGVAYSQSEPRIPPLLDWNPDKRPLRLMVGHRSTSGSEARSKI